MAVAGCCHLVSRVVYNVYFHPLSNFPGPKWRAAFRSTWVWSMVSGSNHLRIKSLHDQYGPVVRVAPDELSFTDPTALPDIHSKSQSNKGLSKSKFITDNQPLYHPFDGNDEEHTRIRRKLLTSFSDKAVASREPILQQYIDKLVGKLRQERDAGRPVNLVEWLNWFSFDLIGELTFSESFSQLDRSASHPWITLMADHIKTTLLHMCSTFYQPFGKLLRLLTTRAFQHLIWQLVLPVRERIDRRLTRPDAGELNDIFGTFQPHNNGGKEFLGSERMIGTFFFFIIAGSETTSSTLAGLVNLLTQNPPVMEKLRTEIQSVARAQGLTLAALAQTPYLNAAIKEGLRLCHPVVPPATRITPPEGKVIAGHYVPGNTCVGFLHYVANRSEANFESAGKFLPERWLREKGLDGDTNAGFYPFSVGGHDCLGQNQAWATMRLVLANLVLEFEMEAIAPFPWEAQSGYATWKKRPYMVRLT
ncbi:cytochrome P450 [Aspergillus karnatakaensis]|uniref:cytochrome P450 n=1 Tax=Aspergillus karnatakaensis TaxID=1810916 RepID=UPI003CCE2A96